MTNRLGLMQSLGRIDCVGAPYHGLLVNTTLTNEVDASAMAYPHNASRNWVNLIEVPEAYRGPERTAPEIAADAALGHVYKDHAFIVGLQRRIHGITLGVDNWLYIDTTGKAWRVIIPDVTPTTSVIPAFDLEFERFGLITDAALETKTVTVASIASGQSTAPVGRTSFGTMNVWDFTKTGNKAVLSIYQSAEHPVGFVELTITDDGSGNFSASQSVYKTRSEMLHAPTDTGKVYTVGGPGSTHGVDAIASYREASMRRGIGARYDASGTLEFIECATDFLWSISDEPPAIVHTGESIIESNIELIVDGTTVDTKAVYFRFKEVQHRPPAEDRYGYRTQQYYVAGETIRDTEDEYYEGASYNGGGPYTLEHPVPDGWLNENATGESSEIEEGNSYHCDGFLIRKAPYGGNYTYTYCSVRKLSNKVYGIVAGDVERRDVLGNENIIYKNHESYFGGFGFFRWAYLSAPDGHEWTDGYNADIPDTWNSLPGNAAYNPKTHEILLAGDDTASYTDTIGWV